MHVSRSLSLLIAVLVATLSACATPEKSGKKAKKKKAKTGEVAKSEASSAPEAPPPPPVPAAESTTIAPHLTYRASSLMKRPESVYFKDEFKNTVDQIYATIRFERSYDFRHSVVIEPTFRTVRENPSKMDSLLLEQAFIDTAIVGNLFMTVGKKTEYEGSGFMTNPSDLLNEDKDLFDPLYQKEGKVFSRLRYAFSESTLGLGFVPIRGQEAKKGRGWLQFSTTIKDVDLKLSAMHQETQKTTSGVSFSRYFGEIFELHYDARYQARQRLPTDEGQRYIAYSSYKFEDPSAYHLFGTRFVITGRRTIVLEGIQQQSGLLPEEFKAFHADLRTERQDFNKISAIPVQLHGRRYGFISYQDDDSIKSTHLGASYLSNLNDQSRFATANILHHLSPITSVELNTMLFLGGVDSEFGEMPFPRATHLVLRGKF